MHVRIYVLYRATVIYLSHHFASFFFPLAVAVAVTVGSENWN